VSVVGQAVSPAKASGACPCGSSLDPLFGERKTYGHGRWRRMNAQAKSFALCIDNSDYLILGQVYRILPDLTAAKDDLVRIVDESGEDYLCHKDHFMFVDFPSGVKEKILALQGAT
jgi:hypothetical protein